MLNRVTVARALRLLLPVGYVTLAYAAGMVIAIFLIGPEGPGVIAMAFVAAAASVAGVGAVQRQADRLIRRVVLRMPLTPYHALAAAAGRLRVGSWEQALPGLARALAEGTAARQASVWLDTDDHLVSVATWPSALGGFVRTADNLTALRALPEVDHAVAIVDGDDERGALAIHKPSPGVVSQEDRRLMRDVANTAGLLLRGLTLNAELRDRVQLAEQLEEALRASRRRVMQARDIERRRSVTEITTVTGTSLAAIRAELARVAEVAADDPEGAARRLAAVRPALEDLIERFRAVVRGVFPGVLRDEGPRVALEEFAGDLPRPVQLTGELGPRTEWEIESGVYFVTAAAMRLLCRGSAVDPLHVQFGHDVGRLTARIVDRSGVAPTLAGLRQGLTDQEDRLAALGGGLRLEVTPGCATVLAWLPDRLQPTEAAALISSVPPATGEAPADDPRAAQAGGHLGGSRARYR
jgi:signal transduction histidine kinase